MFARFDTVWRWATWPLVLSLVAGVRTYQLLISPWLPPGTCRFEPSCSHYAIAALRSRGLVIGSLLAGWRVLRCNPYCAGGHEPVPERGFPPWQWLRSATPAVALADPTRVSPSQVAAAVASAAVELAQPCAATSVATEALGDRHAAADTESARGHP
jgi:putative membrane protein insertion efficiency factor